MYIDDSRLRMRALWGPLRTKVGVRAQSAATMRTRFFGLLFSRIPQPNPKHTHTRARIQLFYTKEKGQILMPARDGHPLHYSVAGNARQVCAKLPYHSSSCTEAHNTTQFMPNPSHCFPLFPRCWPRR